MYNYTGLFIVSTIEPVIIRAPVFSIDLLRLDHNENEVKKKLF